ncbi:DUF4145 domain-containing protein (plasmid) [Citrobacter sp. RHB20-C16]|uniref:DUF4145 domain-containing protein n=2 Tax=Citrobacter amalonaticus TaxID=35703 RepID=A0ABY0HX82_CITAM|nr:MULTISPECIES: DUF4145 domain-containing protein [Citrobacter]MZK91445.1 DUF4145 domain-containing protein [Citrobacter amalonaticus]MZK96001.1 DUF4145 domain-containing protein [Citrobacter amalonaticus]MZL05731.1 DUF4145 domain-containing protein [Citrobacter amalonaticus]MZL25770.1 DUF4145 domain-containing protein [Citrobacter amalonaticus]MZL43671.1 DUF4145 domain-containing protein [Citrobacter amalonaticus]
MSDKIFKAPCPSCKRKCNTIVLGEKSKEWNEESGHDNYVYGKDDHKLLECCGCGTIFYYKKSWNSEHTYIDANGNEEAELSVVTVPAIENPSLQPDWVSDIYAKDVVLFHILTEVYTAYAHHAFILAATGLRTAFDHTTSLIDIPPNDKFEQKVKAVFDKGYVSETERGHLAVVTEAGNAAAHRGWRPTKTQFESLLHVVEKFVQNVVLRDREIEKIGEAIPKKPKTPKTPKKNDTPAV